MIEKRAIIETGATIGKGNSIGAYCYIGKDVVIGENNTIASHVVIDGQTTMGDNNVVGSHTVLGTAAQDIKTSSGRVGLHIGDNNTVGSRVFVTAGTEHGGGSTRIGDDNQLADGIHIGHDVQMGSHCHMEKDAALGGHVIIGDHVRLGKDTAVHQFVEIGSFAALEAGAALTQDLPPYCTAKGNRAKITGVHQTALEKYFSPAEARAIQEAYSLIFTEGSPKDNATAALKREGSETTQCLYRFIADSKRGIPFKRKTNVN